MTSSFNNRTSYFCTGEDARAYIQEVSSAASEPESLPPP